MSGLGASARKPAQVFLTGGASAVLEGWRDSTIDVDLTFRPDDDGAIFEAIQRLKEELEINVELATPADFVPVPAGWEARSPHIATHGMLSFHHVEFVAQALAKLERGHQSDLRDVDEMLRRGLVSRAALLAALDEVSAATLRYPAVDVKTWRAAVNALPD